MHWQSQVTAELLRGSLVLAFCVLHSVKTLGAGRRQRWDTRVLEGRVTGVAISLPRQEGCGWAVTNSPPARVPNRSMQYLALPSGCAGRHSTFAGLLPVPASPPAPHSRRKKSPCWSQSEKKVVSSLPEERLWDGL